MASCRRCSTQPFMIPISNTPAMIPSNTATMTTMLLLLLRHTFFQEIDLIILFRFYQLLRSLFLLQGLSKCKTKTIEVLPRAGAGNYHWTMRRIRVCIFIILVNFSSVWTVKVFNIPKEGGKRCSPESCIISHPSICISAVAVWILPAAPTSYTSQRILFLQLTREIDQLLLMRVGPHPEQHHAGK